MRSFILLVLIASFLSMTIIAFGQTDLTIVKNFDKLTATQTGVITINVKNVGNDVGTFQIKAECGNVCQLFTPTQIITIQKGETKPIDFIVSGGEQRTSCAIETVKFTVTDTTSFKSDTASTSFDVCSRPECTDGQLSTSFENGQWMVYECSNGITQGRLVLVCGTGSVLKPTDSWPWQKCVNEGKFTPTALIISLVVGLAIAVLYLAYKLGKKNAKKK